MIYAALRAFHAVASSGGFTKAAARLNVTQPTLSAQVKTLEERYGVPLFHRRGRKVEPTGLGEDLLRITRRMFDCEAEALELLTGAQRLLVGELAIGADSPHHVIQGIAAFDRRYPGVTVSLSIGNSDQVLRELYDYRADLGVLADPPADPRLVLVELRRDPLVALVPRDHAWAKRRAVPLADLAAARLIMREPGSITRALLERAFAAAGIAAATAMEIDSREAVREAVAAGLGVSVMSAAETGADPRLTTVPLRGAELLMTEYLVRLAERRVSRPAQAFLDLFVAAAAAKTASTD